MVELIKGTDTTTVFLTLLESRGIIGDTDVDKLVRNFLSIFTHLIQNVTADDCHLLFKESILSRHEKNQELYSILKTRTGAFISLICALNGTNQTRIRDKLYYGIAIPRG